uniref:Uncharacterized protein n=1 Tax=Anguilla anguilla TaxID=7936 RepID=A0A0E9X403_ANGAN
MARKKTRKLKQGNFTRAVPALHHDDSSLVTLLRAVDFFRHLAVDLLLPWGVQWPFSFVVLTILALPTSSRLMFPGFCRCWASF